jgi:hypothetical protein
MKWFKEMETYTHSANSTKIVKESLKQQRHTDVHRVAVAPPHATKKPQQKTKQNPPSPSRSNKTSTKKVRFAV